MVSIGRGRGRGHTWVDSDEVPLPKPGKSYFGDTDYINLVNIINTTDIENVLQKRKIIAEIVVAAVKNDLRHLHSELYKHALMNEEFGQRLMMIYADPAVQEIRDSESKNIKYYLLGDFQLHFERKEKWREENVVQFRNDICLLSKYFSLLPYKNSVIRCALLDYMDMLLGTATTEDITLFTEQIAVHGEHFYNMCREKIDDLMVTARRVLLEQDLSLTSRQMLLYAIDLHGAKFNPLPVNLLKFYKLQFKKNAGLLKFL